MLPSGVFSKRLYRRNSMSARQETLRRAEDHLRRKLALHKHALQHVAEADALYAEFDVEDDSDGDLEEKSKLGTYVGTGAGIGGVAGGVAGYKRAKKKGTSKLRGAISGAAKGATAGGVLGVGAHALRTH